MKETNDILDELISWGSPLAGMSREMPYTVPDMYFDHFPETMRHIVEIESSLKPSGNKNVPIPYTVPQNYFEQLPLRIVAGIKDRAQEADNEQEVEVNRVIPLRKSNVWWSMRLAAAALLMTGIGIGSYRTQFLKKHFDTEKALSRVPRSEINEYVQQNIDDFDVEMLVSNLPANGAAMQPQQLDNKEIIDYLNENGWQDID